MRGTRRAVHLQAVVERVQWRDQFLAQSQFAIRHVAPPSPPGRGDDGAEHPVDHAIGQQPRQQGAAAHVGADPAGPRLGRGERGMHRGGDVGGLGRAVARAVLVGLEEAQVGIAIEVGDGVGASARARSPSLAILPQIGVQIAPG